MFSYVSRQRQWFAVRCSAGCGMWSAASVVQCGAVWCSVLPWAFSRYVTWRLCLDTYENMFFYRNMFSFVLIHTSSRAMGVWPRHLCKRDMSIYHTHSCVAECVVVVLQWCCSAIFLAVCGAREYDSDTYSNATCLYVTHTYTSRVQSEKSRMMCHTFKWVGSPGRDAPDVVCQVLLAVCCSVVWLLAVGRSVLQCFAVCCSALLRVAAPDVACRVLLAVCCSVVQLVAVCCSVLQCFAVCCSARCGMRSAFLQCAAVRCSLVQSGAIWCCALQWFAASCSAWFSVQSAPCSVLQCGAVGCSAQQCFAICCSARGGMRSAFLQCVAVCGSALQWCVACCSAWCGMRSASSVVQCGVALCDVLQCRWYMLQCRWYVVFGELHAVCCSALQCGAVSCCALQWFAVTCNAWCGMRSAGVVWCSLVQCVAVVYSALQWFAVHCSSRCGMRSAFGIVLLCVAICCNASCCMRVINHTYVWHDPDAPFERFSHYTHTHTTHTHTHIEAVTAVSSRHTHIHTNPHILKARGFHGAGVSAFICVCTAHATLPRLCCCLTTLQLHQSVVCSSRNLQIVFCHKTMGSFPYLPSHFQRAPCMHSAHHLASRFQRALCSARKSFSACAVHSALLGHSIPITHILRFIFCKSAQ